MGNAACGAILLVLLAHLLCPHTVASEGLPQAEQQGEQGAAAGGAAEELPEEDEPEVADGSYFKFRGVEWHPQSFGTTNCSAPTPLVNETGNIFECQVLRDVCVDQGVIIYQDQRYHPWTSEIRLPLFNISDILWNTPSLLGIGDKWKTGKNRYLNPHVRPWHHMEESEDIRQPVFSNCTTPLLFFHHFPFNVAEVYRFAVNNLYFLQQRLRFFDEHITLVPSTPHMSRVPGYTRFWLQPFSRKEIISLGDLSQRRGPGVPSGACGEGRAVRCFSRFIMCKLTLKKPTYAFFDAGQFVAEYYLKQAAPHEANYTARLAELIPREALHDTSVLKVVFAVRSKSHKDIGRVLLNEDELIDRCNRQEARLPTNSANATATGNGNTTASRLFSSVRCIRHVFGVDNLYDMWLVRQMDVLVGVHGSALTNAMFMRRGSSIIELRPYGFSGRESWPNIYMKSQTRRMEVFWFGIDVMDANLSTPGDFERDMQPIYTRSRGCLARDRNVAIPWVAMAHQLANVAAVSRSVMRYKVLRHSHAYYVTHDIKPVELKDKYQPAELLTWFTDPEAERARAMAIPLTPEGEAAAEAAERARIEEILRKRRQAEKVADEKAAAAADAAGVGPGAGARAAAAAGGAAGATGDSQAAQQQQAAQGQQQQQQAAQVQGQAQGQQAAGAGAGVSTAAQDGQRQGQGQGQGQQQEGGAGDPAAQSQAQAQWQAAAQAQEGDQQKVAAEEQALGLGLAARGGAAAEGGLRRRNGGGMARLAGRTGRLGVRPRVRAAQGGTGDQQQAGGAGGGAAGATVQGPQR